MWIKPILAAAICGLISLPAQVPPANPPAQATTVAPVSVPATASTHYLGEPFKDWLSAENLSMKSVCSAKGDKKACNTLKTIRFDKKGEFTDSHGVRWIFYDGRVASVEPSTAIGGPKHRMFIGDAEAFFSSSFGSAAVGQKNALAVHGSAAGMEQMTVLAMKAFHDNCPKLTIVNKPEIADYFVRLDRNGTFVRYNALAVFDVSGEMIFVGAGAGLAKQVKRFCPQVH